jgi:hypothetical protein
MVISMARIKAISQLFDEVKCSSGTWRRRILDDCDIAEILSLLDEEKMKCHIINCLAALQIVRIEKKRLLEISINKKHELVKKKVFQGACLILMDDEFSAMKNPILDTFPDKSKMTSGQSWLPMHFAIVLYVENKISEEDVHTLYSIDPLALRRLSNNKGETLSMAGCTPAHLLCRQKQPNMLLVRYFCLRDPQAFLIPDQKGRCALHLVAIFAENLEMLQLMIQIDHKMTKRRIPDVPFGEAGKSLGLLCKRSEFLTKHEMVSSLIEVDSSVEVICDGILGCLLSSDCSSLNADISTGSGSAKKFDLLKVLLEANSDAAKHDNSRIFHRACDRLRGEFGVAVLTLFLRKNRDGIKCLCNGRLPIHFAAQHSSLDVLTLLHKAYPESLSMVATDHEYNMLHLVLDDTVNSSDNRLAKLQYICDQCPQLIHMKGSEGSTALHRAFFQYRDKLDLEAVKILCKADETVVRDKFTPSNSILNPNPNPPNIGEFNEVEDCLPLYLLIKFKPLIAELSDEGDCLRLFLRLYPASAGIEDGHSISPYDLAVSKNLSKYVLRILLAADPTIDPVRRGNLNFEARKEGMFLAFRALSTTMKPTVWSQIRFKDVKLLERVMSYL